MTYDSNEFGGDFSVVHNLSAVKETVDIIRRIAERGLDIAIINKDSDNVDVYQHILDEIAILKTYLNNE